MVKRVRASGTHGLNSIDKMGTPAGSSVSSQHRSRAETVWPELECGCKVRHVLDEGLEKRGDEDVEETVSQKYPPVSNRGGHN